MRGLRLSMVLRQQSIFNVAGLRCLTTVASPPTVRRIDHNIQLQQHAAGIPDRPLILMLGWLFAKPAHLKKYESMYVNEGFDVVTVQVRLGQVLFPKRAQLVVRNVLDLMNTSDLRSRPVIVHQFSVGAYLFGEILLQMRQNSALYSNIGRRIYGQVLDSPVDFYGIPVGFSKAIAENSHLRKAIQATLDWYLSTFSKTITGHYIRASDIFRENSLKLPSRLLYSLDDPVCDPKEIEKLASEWRQNGIDAETKSWEHAHHVSMFLKYPDEYANYVRNFVQECKVRETVTSDLEDTIPTASL